MKKKKKLMPAEIRRLFQTLQVSPVYEISISYPIAKHRKKKKKRGGK